MVKEVDIIYKIGDSVTLHQGDCIETMRTLPDNSVDSIVTDPPYELGFMNKSWDSTGIANNVEMWKECLRVLKPGGHLLSFGGTRTYHRMACAIEDAGFEIRDQMQWLYGSGFPKGQDIGKQIDKSLGVKRDIVGIAGRSGSKRNCMSGDFTGGQYFNTKPGTDEARRWDGWNTQLKPAHEPICLARKPISEKTVAENVLKWGTGGLNIDACRIATQEEITNHSRSAESAKSKGKYGDSKEQETHQTTGQSLGRFPANIILDKEAGALLDAQGGTNRGAAAAVKKGYGGESNGIYGDFAEKGDNGATFYGDTGGASRFFYCAKASKSERNAGLDGMDKKASGSLNFRNPSASGRSDDAPSVAAMGGLTKASENHHPTVKPVKLMEYLIKLITPPNGIVLDPFMGSGSTGIATRNLGLRFVGIEKEKEYCEIAKKRLESVSSTQQIGMLELA